MEHIDGKDLGSTIARARGTGLPPIVAAFIAAECCEALDHAHRRRGPASPDGVIHRDVTPRNILLSWGGEVKLADFGIAAVVGEARGDSIGTPGYMAPEQALGAPVDIRADLYALGMVLWESVLGDHVRRPVTRAEAAEAARSGALPPIADTIPSALAAIIERATAREPADRWPSARAMADALDAFIVSERGRDGGPAPAIRLRGLLAERWGSERDEPTGDELDPGARIVTFIDDGEDRVRDSTARSLAETAADSPAPTSAPAPVPRSRRRVWPIAAIATAGAIAIAVVSRSSPTPRTASEPPPPATIAPAPVTIATTPVPDETAPVPPPETTTPPMPRPPPRSSRPAAPSDPPRSATRSMTIGARPWAHFTVDDDPTRHLTPATVELAVGPHRVTFTNPELGITRTVTVTVPGDGAARYVETLAPP